MEYQAISQRISIEDMSTKRCVVLACEALLTMGWQITVATQGEISAMNDVRGNQSWKGHITLELQEEWMLVTCTPYQTFPAFESWEDVHPTTIHHIDRFAKLFSQLRETLSEQSVDKIFAELNEELGHTFFKLGSKAPKLPQSPITSYWQYIAPTRDYWAVPVLAMANVLVYIVMLVYGTPFFNANGDDILVFGGSSVPTTLFGDWWRLISSSFVHFGFDHILVNLIILLLLGHLVEPVLGKARLIVVYLLSGVLATLGGLWLNDFGVSAGASSSIFGVAGCVMVVIGLLPYSVHDKKNSLAWIAMLLVPTLAYGLLRRDGGLVLHLGGLVGGMLIGAIYAVVDLTASARLRYPVALLSAVLITIGITVLSIRGLAGSDRVTYMVEVLRTYEMDQEALDHIYDSDSKTNKEYSPAIYREAIACWQRAIQSTEALYALDLADHRRKRLDLFVAYAKERIGYCQLMIQTNDEPDHEAGIKLREYNARVRQYIEQMAEIKL